MKLLYAQGPASDGIYFTGQVSVPSTFAGTSKWCWVQLVTPNFKLSVRDDADAATLASVQALEDSPTLVGLLVRISAIDLYELP